MDRKTEILALLKVRGAATLGEVARSLGLSKQGALRHLEALQGRGLVAVSARQPQGRGRPGHSYQLTAAAAEHFPSGHRELALDLVDFLESAEVDRFFAARAQRLEAEYGPKLAGLDFEGRVRELARLAGEHGHMTEVVEQPGGRLQLRHCNCPIQDVAAKVGHPCRQEQDLYRRLLHAEVVRSTWLGSGDTTCTYDITVERKEVG
jgi:predicted ArsR family transcriptional regulator